MNTTSSRTVHILEQIVNQLPIGTNLALLQLIWAIMAGHFLNSRGAVHSALKSAGLMQPEIQRSWSALRKGVWHIDELIRAFKAIVHQEGSWQANEYEGYRPVAVDITAIWRPRLKGWKGTIYRQLLGKRYCGIGFGLIARIGQVDDNRLPLLERVIRGRHSDDSEDKLKASVLKQAAANITGQDVFIHDAGVSIAEVQAAGVEQYVIRLARNCTARNAALPTYKGRGCKPKKGTLIRPLARMWKEKLLTATEPDVSLSFIFRGRKIIARGWQNVMRADLKVADSHELYTIWIFDDPMYKSPLPVGTNLLTAGAKTVFQLYCDRWPVEQIPLVAKQLLGCQRQFVFAPISCWRLGELAFLAGNILTWLAATSDPIPSGYWDRVPKKRQDAIAGSWQQLFFQKNSSNCHDFEKSNRKRSICQRELLPIGESKRVNRTYPVQAS